MIYARFKTSAEDPRPINWPIKHPYWISGKTETHSIVVCYADDEKEILSNWPEAEEIDSMPVDKYLFSSRFPKPKWLVES